MFDNLRRTTAELSVRRVEKASSADGRVPDHHSRQGGRCWSRECMDTPYALGVAANHDGFAPKVKVCDDILRRFRYVQQPSQNAPLSREAPRTAVRHVCAPIVVCLLSGVLASSCQVVAGYEDFQREQGTQCQSLKRRKIGGRGQWLVRVDIPRGGCFWIDQDEVTVREYEDWLDQLPGDFDDWDGRCVPWKSDLGPSDPSRDEDDECAASLSETQDSFGDLKPIRCVDFCDAEAFCRTSGDERGHLCWDNNASGISEPEGKPAQWEFACTNSGSTQFPWGDEQIEDNKICNIAEEDLGCGGPSGSTACGPADVETFSDCVNDSGVTDLIGNVAEWIFSCRKADEINNPDTKCNRFGGSYLQSRAAATCSSISETIGVPKNSKMPDLGFRCCVELATEEEAQLAQ